MGLMEGYKLAEVGVIPTDWGVARFGDLCSVMRGGSPRPIQDYITDSPDGINWIKIGDVGAGAKYIESTAEKITAAGLSRSRFVRVGDFLLSNSMSFGRPYILRTDGGIHDGWLVIQDYQSTFHTEFLYYYLSGRPVLAQYMRLAAGSSVLNLNKDLVSNVSVAVPSQPEQRAIAEALSDIDALLTGLDRLIAKKRDLKQAAMQQLLTGQTRLPGFEGEWAATTFGQVVQSRSDRIDPRSSGKQDFCVELEHIAPASGELLGSTSAGEQSSLKSVFTVGDVLFGKLRAYLRKYWLATCDGVCSTEIWVLRPKSQLMTAEFLFQLVKMDDFIEAASNSYGTHMPRSDWGIVKNFAIALPSLLEQASIATVLSDMDAELAALEARRDKTRALKQGMMQELLTGRTRLI